MYGLWTRDDLVVDVSSVMVFKEFFACWELDLAASKALEVVLDMVDLVILEEGGEAACTGAQLSCLSKL